MTMNTSLKIFLATANCGSIFENIDEGLERWLDEFLKAVRENTPEFVAVHIQETGGKNYQNCQMEVHRFFNELRQRFEEQKFIQIEGFVDSESQLEDQFTALSSLYFVHEDLNQNDVQIWNFKDKVFSPVSSEAAIHIGEDLGKTERKQKEKFPKHFFPEFKWSRKGFIRTRWSIRDQVLDLVNIHLFHDSCNLIAGSAFPSPFAKNRFKTLNYTLDKLCQDDDSKSYPMFIFGDFNFRLNTYEVFEILRRQISDSSSDYDKSKASPPHEKLAIESKFFSCPEHERRFKKDFDWLRPYEFEAKQFPHLLEWNLDFHPSYPFAEDDSESFAKTRCPAWCDRVLFTNSDIITSSDESQPVCYDLIGSDLCMGDHKPVFLSFTLRNPNGKMENSSSQEKRAEIFKEEQEGGKNLSPSSSSSCHCQMGTDTENSLKLCSRKKCKLFTIFQRHHSRNNQENQENIQSESDHSAKKNSSCLCNSKNGATTPSTNADNFNSNAQCSIENNPNTSSSSNNFFKRCSFKWKSSKRRRNNNKSFETTTTTTLNAQGVSLTGGMEQAKDSKSNLAQQTLVVVKDVKDEGHPNSSVINVIPVVHSNQDLILIPPLLSDDPKQEKTGVCITSIFEKEEEEDDKSIGRNFDRLSLNHSSNNSIVEIKDETPSQLKETLSSKLSSKYKRKTNSSSRRKGRRKSSEARLESSSKSSSNDVFCNQCAIL